MKKWFRSSELEPSFWSGGWGIELATPSLGRYERVSSSSISKMSVELGGMTGGWPRSP
jgi:hypothetical protein